MKTPGKYVVFYCDQCDLLSGVITTMLKMYPGVEVKTHSGLQDLLNDVNSKLPEFILVYMTLNDESSIGVVKRIRESVGTSDTPVVIYQSLPDESELRKLSPRIA